jgi:hypothetical protein
MTATRLEQALDGAPASHVEAALGVLLELRLHDPSGDLGVRQARDLGRRVADRMLDDADRWHEHLGPCLDVTGVREVLGQPGRPVSKQAVSQRRGLLALTTGSGRVVYPAFQFEGRSVVPGLAEVLRALPEDLVSRWTVASWLVSPDAELQSTPISLLRAGRTRPVAQAAHDWAIALAA